MFSQEAFSDLLANDGANESPCDEVGEPVNVGGDANTDVDGDDESGVFYVFVFLKKNPERKGDREGYRGVT